MLTKNLATLFLISVMAPGSMLWATHTGFTEHAISVTADGAASVYAEDVDNDGDLDIVYSRAGVLYVGTALQIIENLGDKQFKDHGIFPLVEAPDDYVPKHEGNEWNDFIEMIKFRDIDKDGDIDLFLTSSMSYRTNGMILLNQGNFSFEILPANIAKTYLTDVVKPPVSEEQRAQEQAVEDEIAAFEVELAAELGQ